MVPLRARPLRPTDGRTIRWGAILPGLAAPALLLTVAAASPSGAAPTPEGAGGTVGGRPGSPPAATSGPERRDERLRALLSDRCFPCHGPDASARRADLRLDRHADLQAFLADGGGELLLERVAHPDPAERMPPPEAHRAALTPDEVDELAAWLAEGAPELRLWCLVPPRRARLPEVRDAAWPRGAVDRFVLARLEAEGLAPSPDADGRTLCRRLAFDLCGLPPTPEEVARFAARWDAGDEAVLGEWVDELLARPAHAERLAVWWLDLVRYGDSSGYHSDRPLPAWPYRDWVLEAFASNLPFDRFTELQLAGDLVPGADVATTVPTAYHRLCKVTDENGAQAEEYLAKYAADRVRTTATTWLGLTLGCAECHDHKFDPLPTRDFYRFAAFFADLDQVGVYELRDYRAFEPLLEVPQPDGSTVPCVVARAVEPRATRVLRRGDWMDTGGEEVRPGTPDCLPPLPGAPAGTRATRLDLARWLVDGANPLTGRVLANRLWYLFFGRGLTPDLEDLGSQGGRPSHPELLDHLALELSEGGWDLRHLVRTLVTSRAYRQSSDRPADDVDAERRAALFGRQGRWRLDAEFLRDRMLADAGLLDRTVGGPSVFPHQPAGYWQHLNFPRRRWRASEGGDRFRRGLYTHWQRTYLHPFLLALDAPSREESCARRPRTRTPLAALALLDGPTAVEAAGGLVRRALERLPDGDGPGLEDRAVVAELVRLALQREALEDELRELVGLVGEERARFAGEPEAWAALLDRAHPDPGGRAALLLAEDGPRLAALTQAARVVLNLTEGTTRR